MTARPVKPKPTRVKPCEACKGKKTDAKGRICRPCAGTGVDTRWR